MYEEVCLIDAGGGSMSAVAPPPFRWPAVLAWLDRWAPVWPVPVRALRIDRVPTGPPLKCGKGMA